MQDERLFSSSTGRRGIRLASVLAVGAGLTLAACGGSTKQPPAQAVDSSVSSLGSSSSLNLRLSLDNVTPSQIQQLSKKGGGSALTSQEATALSTGSIFFTAQTGSGEALDSKQAVTDPKDAYDLGLQFGASDVPLEIKYVGENLYARVDLTQLLTDVGQDPSQVASFQKDLSTIDSVIPGISDFGTSKWVELNHASLTQIGSLLKAAEASSGSSQPNANQIQSTMAQLRTDAVNSLKANSTYTSLGTHNGRPEYQMTLNVHGFLASFGPDLQKDLSTLPMVGSKFNTDFGKIQDKIPANQTAISDLYTSGGKLSEVDVDLNQFAGSDKVSFPVPVQAKFSAPPAISTPTGATVLDTSQLPKLLQDLSGGGLGSNTSTGSSAGA